MNATTTPPPCATSTAAPARNKAPASAQPTPAALFSQISEMLHRAWLTADDDCAIDGCILLKTARNHATAAADDGVVMGSREVEARGYEIAALIKAVQAIPGFRLAARDRWIEAAAGLLVVITNDADVMDGGREPPSKIPEPGSRQEKFLELATAFYQAAQTDEAENRTGDSTRLLFLAADEANRIAERTVLSAETSQNEAFNLTAIVKAALSVVGDVASKDRRSYLDLATPVLVELTSCTVDELFAPLPVAKSAVGRLELARQANYEITKLVDMMRAYEQAMCTENSAAFLSAFSRISLLGEIVFYAANLGATDADGSTPTLAEMQRRFIGAYN